MSQNNFRRAASTLRGLSNRTALALGLTQTIGYGTLYYAYGVLAPGIAQEFGVGPNWFFGVFSIGILLGGLVAPAVGRAVDRHGAHLILTIGSLLAALSLCLCALAPSLYLFAPALVLTEMAACFVLYEAAFAGLTQIHGHEARGHITSVTLIAGFASTIFWPLTQELTSQFGWRWTLVIFAAAHLAICLPVHYFFLREAKPVQSGDAHDGTERFAPRPFHKGRDRQRAFALYAMAICASGVIYSAFPIHMLTIIANEGFSTEHAALLAMFMGPAQVAARLTEASFGQRFDALTTGKISLAALAASIAILLATPGSLAAAIAFASFYGVSQGLITIARGTVPLQLFGLEGYGALVGRISGLRFFVNAAAPFLFSALSARAGTDFALLMCGAVALLAMLAFWQLERPNTV